MGDYIIVDENCEPVPMRFEHDGLRIQGESDANNVVRILNKNDKRFKKLPLTQEMY